MHRLMLLLMPLAGTVAAHDGHGLSGVHPHASDLVGVVLIALVLGVGWLLRGRR